MAHGAFSAPRSHGSEAIHFFGLFRCIRGSRLCIRRAVMLFTPSQKVVKDSAGPELAANIVLFHDM